MTTKRKNHLASITPEEREAIQAKSKAAMAEKKAWAKEHLRNDFADNPLWRELAKKYDVKLPPYYEPNTETKYLHRVFKKTGTCCKEYLEACGATTLKQLASMNPAYPAFGFWLGCWRLDEKSTNEQSVDENKC